MKEVGKPIFINIQEELRNQIAVGAAAPGNRIPSEAELARQYSTSRMTARRAIEALVFEGLLVRKPGKGTYVALPKVTHIPRSIFSLSEIMAKQGYQITSKPIIKKVIKGSRSVSASLHLTLDDEIIYLERLRLINGEPFAFSISYLPLIVYKDIMDVDLNTLSINKAMYEISGKKMVMSSDDVIEVTEATQQEAKGLRTRPGAALFVLRGTVYDEDGKPARVTKTLFRGDRVKFMTSANSDEPFLIDYKED